MSAKSILNLSPIEKGESYTIVRYNDDEYLQVLSGDEEDEGIMIDPETSVPFGENPKKMVLTAEADFTVGLLAEPLYGDEGGRYFKTTMEYDSETQQLVGARPC